MTRVTAWLASRHPARRAGLLAAALGLLAALAVGGVAGGAVGAAIVVVAYRGLRRGRLAGAKEDERLRADLPFVADLLAAALRAGAAPDVAARCVSAALPGPTGERLARVARALGLGASAEEAWAFLGEAGAARRIVQAAARSQHSGAAFAAALHRVAEDLRAEWLVEADAAGRRNAVLIVLPLGLCFLPAFVLAGVVPVIVAVLGDVLSP
jgi:pilus assembly protein TadC